MPGKHVRFASTNTEYPLRPSVTRSTSLPSSGTSYTSRTSHGVRPGTRFPVVNPAPAPEPIQIHNLLAYSHRPALTWDVTLPPSTLTSRYDSLPKRALFESAFNPTVASIKLTSPLLPWSIPIVASHGYILTVSDVLESIHLSLRTHITKEEYHSIPSHKDRARVNESYERRFRSIRDSRAATKERDGGVRRVDFLRGITRFKGLSPTHRPDVWIVHLE